MRRYAYIIISLSTIFFLLYSCGTDTITQIRPERLNKPIIWGNVPKNIKYTKLASFEESFTTTGDKSADLEVEKICNTNIEKFNGDAIINFKLFIGYTDKNGVQNTFMVLGIITLTAAIITVLVLSKGSSGSSGCPSTRANNEEKWHTYISVKVSGDVVKLIK